MSKERKRVTVTSPTHTGEPPAPVEMPPADEVQPEVGDKVVVVDGKPRRVRVSKLPSGDNAVAYLD